MAESECARKMIESYLPYSESNARADFKIFRTKYRALHKRSARYQLAGRRSTLLFCFSSSTLWCGGKKILIHEKLARFNHSIKKSGKAILQKAVSRIDI